MDAATSLRTALLTYAQEQYGTTPERKWLRYPNYVVLCHGGTHKWYGVVMDVPRAKLELSGDGLVDVLNVKCDPLLVGSLRMQAGYCPAYHMNKDTWISILLDGTVDLQEITVLLDWSYRTTK